MTTQQRVSKVHLLTFNEAADQFDINIDTLASRVRTGSLRVYQAKHRLYLSPQEIAEWKPLWERDYEDVIRKAHAAGKGDADIAPQLGISRERVRQIRKKLKLPTNPRRPRLKKAFIPTTLLEVFSEYRT